MDCLSWLAQIVWQKNHNSGRGTTPSLILKSEFSNCRAPSFFGKGGFKGGVVFYLGGISHSTNSTASIATGSLDTHNTARKPSVKYGSPVRLPRGSEMGAGPTPFT